MDTPPFSDWLVAFFWTCILEAPVYYLVLRRHFKSIPRLLALTLLLNCATHPALWYAYPRFAPYWLWLIIAELSVATVEGLLIAIALRFRPSPPRALQIGLTASAAANLFSTVIGLLAAFLSHLLVR